MDLLQAIIDKGTVNKTVPADKAFTYEWDKFSKAYCNAEFGLSILKQANFAQASLHDDSLLIECWTPFVLEHVKSKEHILKECVSKHFKDKIKKIDIVEVVE